MNNTAQIQLRLLRIEHARRLDHFRLLKAKSIVSPNQQEQVEYLGPTNALQQDPVSQSNKSLFFGISTPRHSTSTIVQGATPLAGLAWMEYLP